MGMLQQRQKLSAEELARRLDAHEAWLKARERGETSEPPSEFDNLDISGADLSGRDLRLANFTNTDLRHSIAIAADFAGARFVFASLAKSDLSESDLSEVIAPGAIFSGARMADAKLDAAELREGRFDQAVLFHATLRDTDCTETDFRGADLSYADLSRANLHQAVLDKANCTGAFGVRLDESSIYRTAFSPRTSTLWIVLRRRYTGPNFILILLFSILFFVPLTAKTLFFGALSVGQDVNTVASVLEQYCASRECVEARSWQVIFGFKEGILTAASATILLLFNICRLILTLVVSPLRDEEDRSGRSPPLSNKRGGWHAMLETYEWLRYPDIVAQTLLAFSLVAAIYNIFYWLSRPLLMPV